MNYGQPTRRATRMIVRADPSLRPMPKVLGLLFRLGPDRSAHLLRALRPAPAGLEPRFVSLDGNPVRQRRSQRSRAFGIAIPACLIVIVGFAALSASKSDSGDTRGLVAPTTAHISIPNASKRPKPNGSSESTRLMTLPKGTVVIGGVAQVKGANGKVRLYTKQRRTWILNESF